MHEESGTLSAGSWHGRTGAVMRVQLNWAPLALIVFALALPQAGCFFRKHKVAQPQARTAARIVLLPMNVPPGNSELRWVALAAPILMAQAIGDSQDLEIVPMWESMPIVKETVGESRTITVENAEYIASRLTARWSTQGEIAPDKAGISLLLDFIPSKQTMVPFRYEKKGPITALGSYMDEAFDQFLRYLVARPPQNRKGVDPNTIRAVAEAMDREYGWFVDAEPGKSEAVVAGFATTDRPIAGLLFNPNLYPGIEGKPTAPAPVNRPSAPATPQAPAPQPPAPRPPQESTAATPDTPHAEVVETSPGMFPGRAEQGEEVEVPPPRSFTQRINSPPALIPTATASPEPAPPARTAPPPIKPAPRSVKSAAADAASHPPAPSEPSRCQLQVFASRSRPQAELLLALLTTAGLKPELQVADLKEKGVWYRVRLNGYVSRRAAAAAGDKLRASALINDYWIVR